MRRQRPLLLAGVLGFLSLWLFRQGTAALGGLEKAGQKMSVVCGTEVSSEDAWEMLNRTEEDTDGESLAPVFWKECGGVWAYSGLTGKSASLRLIYAAGNAELLFPGGNMLAAGDTKGCLVDRDTARMLFGSASVQGQTLTLAGEDYEIRGIVEGQSGVALVQKRRDMDFDTVTVAAGGKRQEEIEELLEGRYGIQGTLEEWRLLYGMAKLALLLFPAAVLTAVLMWIRRYGREASGRGERIFWRLCFWLGLFGGLLWGAFQVRLPSDMVPSTWSDFAFWSNLWEEKTRAFFFLLEMKKRAPELSYTHAFYKCAIFGFASLILYFLSLICYTYYDRIQSAAQSAG